MAISQDAAKATSELGIMYAEGMKYGMQVFAQAMETGDYCMATSAIAYIANMTDDVGEAIGTTAVVSCASEGKQIDKETYASTERFVMAMERLKPGLVEFKEGYTANG